MKKFDIAYKNHNFIKCYEDNDISYVCSKCKSFCFLDSNDDYVLWNDNDFDGTKNLSCEEVIIKSIIE